MLERTFWAIETLRKSRNKINLAIKNRVNGGINWLKENHPSRFVIRLTRLKEEPIRANAFEHWKYHLLIILMSFYIAWPVWRSCWIRDINGWFWLLSAGLYGEISRVNGQAAQSNLLYGLRLKTQFLKFRGPNIQKYVKRFWTQPYFIITMAVDQGHPFPSRSRRRLCG